MDIDKFMSMGLNPPAPLDYELDAQEPQASKKIKREPDECLDVKEEKFKKEKDFLNCGYDSFGSFYCTPCKLSMNSEYTWYTHVIGKRHKKKVASLGYFMSSQRVQQDTGRTQRYIKTTGTPTVYQTQSIKEKAKMQSVFDNYSESPVIGLMFVTEIWMRENDEEPIYMCNLCGSECQKMAIINHVIGFKHRMSYMKLLEMKKYHEISNSSERKSILTNRVEDLARFIESGDGRGKILVELVIPDGQDYPLEEPKCYPEFPRSADKLILAKANNLDVEKFLSLVSLCIDSLNSESYLSVDDMKKLVELKDSTWNNYYEKLSKEIVGDKRNIALTYLLEHKYEKFMEEFFYMTPQPYGCNALPAVEQALKEQGIEKDSLI